MPQTQLQFFELLRSGLWGTPANETLFCESTNWKELFRLSKEQTVFGLVYDGIITLPQSLWPPRTILLNWYAQVNCIETLNRKQNETLVKIYTIYREQGFTPVLLKGQGVATCYRNPLRRNCGDIDLLVGEADYEKVNAYVREKTSKGIHENEKHLSFEFDNQEIENHKYALVLFWPLDNQYFQKITRAWFPEKGKTITINNTPIALPPIEYNVVYLLLHAFDHFITSGLGFRQLMDWSRLLYNEHTRINLLELKQTLKRLHIERLWQIFGCVVVNHLGLPADKFPFYKNKYDNIAALIVEHIFSTGNMGHHNQSFIQRPDGYIKNKIFSLRYHIIHQFKIFRISPLLSSKYLFYFFKIGIRQLWWDIKGGDKAVKGWKKGITSTNSQA